MHAAMVTRRPLTLTWLSSKRRRQHGAAGPDDKSMAPTKLYANAAKFNHYSPKGVSSLRGPENTACVMLRGQVFLEKASSFFFIEYKAKFAPSLILRFQNRGNIA